MRDINIQQYLRKQHFNTVSDTVYSHIDLWLAWYQGEVKEFHAYSVYNGIQMVPCKRLTLGMAKKVCEDWANLLLNEKVEINAGSYQEALTAVLDRNNFRVRANQLVELAYALGTGAFVEYQDSAGNVIIDYIRADMIYPISWDNGDITECAFGSYRVYNGQDCIYLQIHRHGGKGEDRSAYYIENRYVDAETGDEMEIPEDITPIVPTGYEKPLFQIFTPNIQNNIDLDSPMGISVYANSIAQLKGCDLVFDSYMNEYILGKKRIIVPTAAAKIEMSKDGDMRPIFDPNDTVYYAMPNSRQEDLKLTESNMELRAQEHELGLQRALDILSLKCGMGTGRYQFDSKGVKTATEVISDKSDLYQNLRKNELILEKALIDMAQAVLYLLGLDANAKIAVNFDDSIITDRQSELTQKLQLVTAGIMQKWEFRAWYFGETEAQARKAVEVEPETAMFEDEE